MNQAIGRVESMVEFPNWWDAMDESVELRENGRFLEASEASEPSDKSTQQGSVEQVRGYDREVIERVWESAEVVPGNDPELWRKDEWGHWIHRLDYGNRRASSGWEIFDPGVGLHSQGVYAMRPMQWRRFLEMYEVY